MSKLTEKIKNIFKRAKKPEIIKLQKDQSFGEAIQGVSDIARSIRETNKLQLKRNLWRNIFHF